MLLSDAFPAEKVARSPFRFEVLYRSKRSRARVGRLMTPHGIVETPNFVGVGTNGSLKGLFNHHHDALDLQLMFCNTYHLMVQPGISVIKAAGGLHAFIGRQKPIITDSGGFQVFSLAYPSVEKELKGQGGKRHASSLLRVTEEGVWFRSYRNGEKISLTPESSVEAQKDLAADIIIPLDELLPHSVSREALQASFERTHRWELRSLEAHLLKPQGQAMLGVIHGSTDPDLRKKSCQILVKEAFDGFAIGGSLGCDHRDLFETVQATIPHLPSEKPIHLLGIGDRAGIAQGILQGIDTFDSAYPTKIARHGMLLTEGGLLKITRQHHAREESAIEEACPCETCRYYTRAYLHHLFKAKEPSALALASYHNIRFMTFWLARVRSQIAQGKL